MVSKNRTLRVFVAAFVAALFLTSGLALAAGNCDPADCKKACKTECKDKCTTEDKDKCTTECKEKCTEQCKGNDACAKKCSERMSAGCPGQGKGKS